VAGDEHESAGVGPDRLVLAYGQLDQLITAQSGAFAAKADRAVLLPRPLATLDALVDVTDRRLIGGGAPLLLALHDWILSRRAIGRQPVARPR